MLDQMFISLSFSVTFTNNKVCGLIYHQHFQVQNSYDHWIELENVTSSEQLQILETVISSFKSK